MENSPYDLSKLEEPNLINIIVEELTSRGYDIIQAPPSRVMSNPLSAIIEVIGNKRIVYVFVDDHFVELYPKPVEFMEETKNRQREACVFADIHDAERFGKLIETIPKCMAKKTCDRCSIRFIERLTHYLK
jgi:hypothetical protein